MEWFLPIFLWLSSFGANIAAALRATLSHGSDITMPAAVCFCFPIRSIRLALPNLNGFDYMIPRAGALLFMSALDITVHRVNVLRVSMAGLKLLVLRACIGAIGMP